MRGCGRGWDGAAATRVETDYSVSAWAETFVASMTGASRTTPRRSLENRSVDRRQRGVPGFETARRQIRSQSQLSTRSAIDEPLHPARTIDRSGRSNGVRRRGKMPASGDISRGCSSRRTGSGRSSATIGWWSRDGWGEVLLGPDGLRLDEWRDQGCVTTIKSGPHRVVYRVDLPRGDDLRQALPRAGLAGHAPPVGPPRQGAERGQAIRSTSPRSACRRSRRSRWASSGSGSSCSRTTWSRWRSPRRRRSTSSSSDSCRSGPSRSGREIRQKLAAGAGRHDGPAARRRPPPPGLSPRQHPGPDRGRPLEPELVDDRPRRAPARCRRVTWKLARQNLALLDHYFWLRQQPDRPLSLPEGLPAEAIGAAARRPPASPRQIEDATRLWAERLWRRWGRRCRSSNKYFEVYPGRTDLVRGVARPRPGEVRAAARRSRPPVPQRRRPRS